MIHVKFSELSNEQKKYVKQTFEETWQNSYQISHWFNSFEEWIKCYIIRMTDSGKFPMRNALILNDEGKLRLASNRSLYNTHYTVFDNQINEKVESEVDKWFVAQSINNFAHFYLYYLKSNELFGNFGIFEENTEPKGWELATPERIHGGMTKEQATYFILTKVRRLPILPLQ